MTHTTTSTSGAEDQPVSRLDQRVDDLLVAIGRLPDLEGLLTRLRDHEKLAALIEPGAPDAAAVHAGAEFRQALIDVVVEVLALRQMGATS